MPTEDTVQLMWDCATKLTPETHTKRLLKSYYMNKCRKIARKELKLPKDKFGVSQMCPHCGSCWSESEFQLKLRPQHVAKSAKARKLIAKLEESKATQKKGLLSKKQRCRAKWLKKRVASNVEILCDFCQKKCAIPLEKPKCRKSLPSDEEAVQEIQPTAVNTKKKKNKNKTRSKTAGLKIPKELEAEKKKASSLQKPKAEEFFIMDTTTSAVATTKSNPVSLKKHVNAENATIDSAPAAKNSTNNKNVQSSKAFKAKKPKKQKNNTQKPEIKSQTQQKNSLLQLAALLKTQTTKTGGNTAQNRLASLLK